MTPKSGWSEPRIVEIQSLFMTAWHLAAVLMSAVTEVHWLRQNEKPVREMPP